MHTSLKLGALALLVFAAGCSRSMAAPPPPAPAGVIMAESLPAAARAGAAQVPAADRLLIRRAELIVEAREPGTLGPRVEQIAHGAGGFVESSTVSEGRLRATLRVPSNALEQTLDALGGLGEVERRQLSAHDVTEQVYDLEARLQNLRAVRDRLRQHLERATAVADVIAVERELTRVQGEIESMEGRLNRLRTDTAMSQISLEIRQKRVLGPLGQLLAGVAWVIEKLFVIQ